MDIVKFFTDESYLPSAISEYRPRSGQIEAAKIIADSFENYKNAVIEAPTGSGKTMAYLIPAFTSDGKVVISTKTKQLMQQIMLKDVPTVTRILGSNRSVEQLKGRKNYFCPYRFYRHILPNASLYPDAVAWFEKESLYNISEAPWGKLDADVCNLMTADRFQCKVSKCPEFGNCPFYIQREKANNAHVLITNHHLFLSDMSLKASNLQGVFDFRDYAVFDEAHSLPDIYAQYAGEELSLFSVIMFFRENKEYFGPADMDGISSKYFAITNSMKDGKVLYNTISNQVQDFIESGELLVSKTNIDDLKEEYNRYINCMKAIDCDKEGVKIAEKNEHRIIVKFIPLEFGDSFSEGLKQSVISSVFVSATITSGGSFDYFLSEIGLNTDNTQTVALPPSFDFKKQAKLFIPSEKECAEKNSVYVNLIKNIKGSVLIICNSTERMRQVAEMLLSTGINKKVVLQTEANLYGNEAVKNVVLVGCALLREGVDLSGLDFRCVILDKLPFEYPKDFYIESKGKKIEREKGNAFMNFNLPRAVVYFKQAVGRLIRHEEDTGLWVIFDRRILSQKYGKNFLNVLNNVEIINNINDALNFINGGVYE